MKSLKIIAVAFGLCLGSSVCAQDTFLSLGTRPDSREPDLANPAVEWGTDEVNGSFARQLVRYTTQNGATTPTPMPATFISNLKPKGGTAAFSTTGAEGLVANLWPLPNGDVLFSTEIIPGSSNYLYKWSAATGSVGNNNPAYDNKEAVLNMGERAGITPVADIRALHHRSIVVANNIKRATAPFDKTTVLFYGEYNVSATTPHVALWRSDTLGDSWSKVIEWNTVGHQIAHIHGVVQNPYNGWIYIMFGDQVSEDGIVAWDGESAAPPDNTPIDQIANTPGWKAIANTPRARTGDIVFTPPPNGKCVWIPDVDGLQPGETLLGQRADYDLSNLEATGVVPFVDGLPPLLGARSNSSGNIYWASFRNAGITVPPENKLHVWKSTDAGLTWGLAAKVDTLTANTAVPRDLYVKESVSATEVTDSVFLSARMPQLDPNGGNSGGTALFSNISPRLVSNTAPIFVGGSAALTVAQNSSALDLKPNLTVSDTDIGQTETWTQSVAPAHGTLVVSAATASSGSTAITAGGTISYQPTADYSGTDSFSVQVSDGTATAMRSFTVTVNASGSGANLLINPSLELDADANGIPDCWKNGSFGNNTAILTRTPDAHQGSFAQQVQITSYTDGDAKLLSLPDGGCAPAVQAGADYEFSAYYKSTAAAEVVIFYLDAADAWQYWGGSLLPAVTAWTKTTSSTGPVPAGAKALSVAIALNGVGTLITDEYSLIKVSATANVAPTFVDGTTTLAVAQNSAAINLKPNLTVSDADVGQTETWTQSAAPAHGTLVISTATASSGSTAITAGGTITYQPTAGYSGTDSFSVQVSDGLATATRTFSVTVSAAANVAPTFVDGTTTLVVPQNSPAINLKPNLTVSDTDVGQTETWTQSAAPAHGTLVITAATASSGSTAITAGGTITYQPTAGYSGTDSFSVQVSDGLATATRSFTVTVNASGSGANLLINPSLELDVNGDSQPDCWQRGGWGTNTASWTRTTDAHHGSFAQKLQITRYTDGDRKLLPTVTVSGCAPAAQAGATYQLSAYYKSNAAVEVTVFYLDAANVWQYWDGQGVFLPAASVWTEASYTTGPVPAGAKALSFGIALNGLGTLTTDEYSLTQRP